MECVITHCLTWFLETNNIFSPSQAGYVNITIFLEVAGLLPAEQQIPTQQMALTYICIMSTLLYGSESWTLRARQERKLNAFHMHSLRRILNITWQDKVPNNTVLERAGCTSMFTLLKHRRMRWLGHVVCIDDRRIPKDLLYGELVQGKRPTAAIQRCVQEGPKSLEHRPEQLGSNSPQMVSLETDCAERSLQLRRDARSAAQVQENEKKGCSPCRQASVRLRLCPLPQGLSFPYSTLYQNKHLEHNSIVFRD